MYIKSVIIDGFKSYGRRTEIHGFDREFTAITGLNGTGKSNILDSICFVLGILNLGQVRAASLQDLVYKSGQAGITKATVTLIFDNSNVEQCPLGYEKCREISVTRQIVVGGKNKYLINGKIVQNKKVTDFFCSVQLNVNNPNFLIMQGRITKVLNMKPPEILSMIEEAAGTSVYESKREASTKLIEKKDAKVRETNTLLQEEVEPKLEKLRNERNAYKNYQKICRDIEYLDRICVSYRYIKLKEAKNSTEKHIETLNRRIETCRTTIEQNNIEIQQIDENVQSVQAQIDSESGGVLKTIEEELSEQLIKEATASGNLKAAKDSVAQEQKKLSSLEKSIKDDEIALAKKEAQMAQVQGLFESLKQTDQSDELAYKEAQRIFEAVTQGLSTDTDGQTSSLQDQLMAAKQHEIEAQTLIKTSTMEIRHCRETLLKKKAETQTNDKSYEKDNHRKKELEKDIEALQQNLKSFNYENGSFEQLQDHQKQIQGEIRHLKQQLDMKQAYRYDLQYRDPEPNFDRSKVRGMVGKLFQIRDKRNSLALMMTAGGSIYNYVTDDDITSKKILQKGQLQNRVTIIPLNKISSQVIEPKVVKIAQNLVGKENVNSALSLIEYDPYFDPVMKYIFGRTLICRDLDIAKQVTYHQNIMCRSVTLEGDVIDPEGTLTGGSRPRGGNILEELEVIMKIETLYKEKKLQLEQIEKKLLSMEKISRNYNQVKEHVEIKTHDLKACNERLAKTSYHQHQEELAALELRIQNLEADIAKATKKQAEAKAKKADIEFKITNSKEYRERELRTASEKMKLAKKKADESRNNWKKHEQEFETLKLEIEELGKGIENSNKQRQSLIENLVKTKADYEILQNNSSEATKVVADLKKRMKEQKEKISSKNKELRNLESQKEKLQKSIQDMGLEIKKKENELNKQENDSKDSVSKINALMSKYSWIETDSEFFGVKNTRYDYSKESPIEATKKLSNLRENKEKLERTLNLNAMTLLEREEEQYNEAIRRKKIVEQDKEKIQNIICKMDEKKREKLENAWKAVNDNFSSIFSTLLHGAQARLNPVKQNGQLVGLEIKVGFNGVWKESLGELSGGQRSLVALSLVLAMLKFSPAPLYILDEVDAALDMAHTQNIGNMLKTHFTGSQFIIVSLKDGMFNNANVLFRTKYEDGVSGVIRTVNTKTANQGRK